MTRCKFCLLRIERVGRGWIHVATVPGYQPRTAADGGHDAEPAADGERQS